MVQQGACDHRVLYSLTCRIPTLDGGQPETASSAGVVIAQGRTLRRTFRSAKLQGDIPRVSPCTPCTGTDTRRRLRQRNIGALIGCVVEDICPCLSLGRAANHHVRGSSRKQARPPRRQGAMCDDGDCGRRVPWNGEWSALGRADHRCTLGMRPSSQTWPR